MLDVWGPKNTEPHVPSSVQTAAPRLPAKRKLPHWTGGHGGAQPPPIFRAVNRQFRNSVTAHWLGPVAPDQGR